MNRKVGYLRNLTVWAVCVQKQSFF